MHLTLREPQAFTPLLQGGAKCESVFLKTKETLKPESDLPKGTLMFSHVPEASLTRIVPKESGSPWEASDVPWVKEAEVR